LRTTRIPTINGLRWVFNDQVTSHLASRNKERKSSFASSPRLASPRQKSTSISTGSLTSNLLHLEPQGQRKKSKTHASMSRKNASMSLPSLHAPRNHPRLPAYPIPYRRKCKSQNMSASNHYMKGWMVESDGEV